VSESAEGIAARDKELTVEKAVESSKALEGIRLYDHPSSRTTFRDIIPTCQLLFSRKIGDILYAPSTVMINLCADFAKAKSFACMGSVVQVMQSRVVKTDPFDGVLWEIIPRSFNLPMTQANSKVVRGLVGSDGTVLSPRAPHCLAKAMYVGNVARHMHEHPGMWLFSSDGAAENCGLGEELARENFCGTGGVFRRVFLTGEAWTGVIKGAEQAKLRCPMDEFLGTWGSNGWRLKQQRRLRKRRGPMLLLMDAPQPERPLTVSKRDWKFLLTLQALCTRTQLLPKSCAGNLWKKPEPQNLRTEMRHCAFCERQ
jgi:hypothetical protein